MFARESVRTIIATIGNSKKVEIHLAGPPKTHNAMTGDPAIKTILASKFPLEKMPASSRIRWRAKKKSPVKMMPTQYVVSTKKRKMIDIEMR